MASLYLLRSANLPANIYWAQQDTPGKEPAELALVFNGEVQRRICHSPTFVGAGSV